MAQQTTLLTVRDPKRPNYRPDQSWVTPKEAARRKITLEAAGYIVETKDLLDGTK